MKEQKAKKERDAKIKEIKDRVALRVPTYKFEIPKLPPREGTKEYQRWLNPWRSLGQKSPGFKSPVGSPVKAAKELKAAKDTEKKKKKKDRRRTKSGDSYDSEDSDSEDDEDDTSDRKESNNDKKHEDFVIPGIIDAQTGKPFKPDQVFLVPGGGQA